MRASNEAEEYRAHRYDGVRQVYHWRAAGQKAGAQASGHRCPVEAQEGRTIPEIFASDGEEYFRQAEERVAKTLASRSALVIACGGGLPLREESIRPLKESGTVFFLCRDPGEIYDTVSMAGRPLGQGGREAFLARFAQREPVYRRWADHVIQRFETPDQTVRAILEVL